jgi:hypothetical protein
VNEAAFHLCRIVSHCLFYANRSEQSFPSNMPDLSLEQNIRQQAHRKPWQSQRQARPSSGKAAANGGRKSEARSRVTNGQDVLPGVDNRSMRGRRYYDIQTAITNDQGGAEHLPEVKLQLIRRFSGTSVIAEEMEAQYVRGEQINIQDYALECSTLVRLARQIGVNRIVRDVTPTLDQYLAQRNGAAE